MRRVLLAIVAALSLLPGAVHTEPNWTTPISGTPTGNIVEIRWGDAADSGDWEIGLRALNGGFFPVSTGQFPWPNGSGVPFTFSFSPSTGTLTLDIGGTTISHTFPEYAGVGLDEVHLVAKTRNNGNGDSWRCGITGLSVNGVSLPGGVSASTTDGDGGRWITGTLSGVHNGSDDVSIQGEIEFSWSGSEPFGSGVEVFVMLGEPSDPSGETGITVLSPNGGEIVPAGSKYEIRWSSSNVKNVKIYYSPDGGTTWKKVKKKVTASAGSYEWKVPEIQSRDCLIRIEKYKVPDVYDVSDAPFTIDVPPELELTSPGGGEVWTAGTQEDITWTSRGLDSVTIEYTTDGTTWTTVAASAPAASGSYAWNIPETPSETCRVRISGGGVSDASGGTFTILPSPSVTVTSPDGGESWTAGTVREITWTAVNVAVVALQYTTGGGAWMTIEENIGAASGSYSWTVPDTPSESCRVRITAQDGSGASDESDGAFTISPMPSLTLTAPDGGEEWTAGTDVEIRWTAANVGNVKIEFTPDGIVWTTVEESVPAASGSYTWTVPDVVSSECLVRITDVADPGTYDESGAPFSILPAPSLTLLAPNGGEIWTAGTEENITWTSRGLGSVTIEYTTDGSSWTAVETGVDASAGSYTWTIPDTPSEGCSVRISGAGGVATDESDAVFTILPAPSLTLVSPNGGEEWTAGTEETITWTAVNVGSIKIEYTIGDGGPVTVAQGVDATPGSYSWTIPDTPAARASVVISSIENPSVSDSSDDAFTILPAPSITVASPNGGEVYTSGEELTVEWSAVGVGAVNVEFTPDGSGWTNIAGNVPAETGSVTWTLPETDSGFCSVRVSSAGNPAVFDTSDRPFTVRGTPRITVTSPDGGENWTAGSQHAVTWTSEHVEEVDIEYTVDGSAWTPVAEGLDASTGSFLWTVPDVESSGCLVRITASGGGVSDANDDTFTITPAPTITVLSPNGGEEWTAGTQHAVTWTASNVTGVTIEYTTDGAGWTVIAENVNAASGSYTWTLPGTDTSNALVRITASENSSVTDTSDGVFTITPSPTLTLTAPDGGENITAGTSFSITWSSSNVAGITIEYTTDGSTWTVVAGGVDAASGSYAWTVPDTPSPNCLVRITDTADPGRADTSDAAFTIVSPPGVRVTAPNGGEHLTAGTPFNITWSSTNVGTVTIEYTADGSTWETVAENVVAASGSYEWTVPGIETTGCLVRITGTSDTGVSDTSDGAFTVTRAPAVTVVFPNGGERLTAGAPFNITWTSTNVETVDIEFTADGRWRRVARGVPAASGSYEWTAPDINSARCLVKITGNGGVSDQSDGVFSIAPVRAITLVSPNGGEEFTAGSRADITWTSTNVRIVRIRYRSGNDPWVTVADRVRAAEGTFSWTVANKPSDDYIIQVSDAENPNVSDQCDSPFTVRAPDDARIVNVDTGAVYSELAPAVAEVGDGETLEFRKSGVYDSEKIVVDKSGVTIRTVPGLSVRLKAEYKDFCLKLAADGISVSGVTVFDSRKYGIWVAGNGASLTAIKTRDYINKYAVFADGVSDLSISDMEIREVGSAGIKITNSSRVTVAGVTTPRLGDCKNGIIIDGCDDVILSGLDIGTDWEDDIRILNSTNVRLTDSRFRDARNGIYIKGSPGTVVRNCEVEGVWRESVHIENSPSSSLTGGTIKTPDKGVFLKKSDGVSIGSVRITSSGEGAKGVYVDHCTGTSISGCEIDRKWDNGITLNTSPATSITHCIIRKTKFGVFIGAGSHDTSVINNTIVNNASSGIYMKGAVENVTIKNNIIVKNGWEYWSWGIQCQNNNHPGLSITYNDVWNNRKQYKNCSPGTGDISVDPQFVSNFGDVHLRPGSPCIDAGDPADPVGDEPEDNGDRINQGAYGGTSEAQTTSSQVFTIAEAAANGWISLYCHTWDGMQYTNISALSDTELPPWTGFWVYVNRDLDILFPPDPTQGPAPTEMEMIIEPGRYYLVSVPLRPENPDADAVFGDDLGEGFHDGSEWQFWRTSKYDYRTETYTRYTGSGSLADVIPGRGFWIYHVYDIPMYITVSGTPVSQNSYTEFKLPARNGEGTFHMVGNPFPYALKWRDVKVRVPMTEGLPLGKIAKVSLPATMEEIDTWHIDLAVSDPTGTYYDTDNRAGVVENGDDIHAILSTRDLFPVTPEYVRLVLRDPDGADETPYSYDYYPPAKNEYRWRIELTTSFGAIDVNLDIGNIDEVPENYELTLTSPDMSVTEIDDDTVVQTTLNNAVPTVFILTARRKDAVNVENGPPGKFAITNVAPNPFNPSTVLTFHTEHDGHVRARVFSLGGQVVDTMVDEFLPAGRHSYVWDASGHASGVYVIVVETRGARDSRKVTLLK